MKKQKLIKKLNSETLFHSRKMFGMHGNIQWSVKDIINGVLIVRISSSNTDWGKMRADGSRVPSQEQIAENIKNSILHNVPEAKIQATWKEWKPKDGFGFVISSYGKTTEELVKEIMKIKKSGASKE